MRRRLSRARTPPPPGEGSAPRECEAAALALLQAQARLHLQTVRGASTASVRRSSDCATEFLAWPRHDNRPPQAEPRRVPDKVVRTVALRSTASLRFVANGRPRAKAPMEQGVTARLRLPSRSHWSKPAYIVSTRRRISARDAASAAADALAVAAVNATFVKGQLASCHE